VLELAAGPADHAVEFARRGAVATALDLSTAMCARAAERAAEPGLALDVVHADMTDFRLDRRYDLALLLLDSASVLLTDDAMAGFLAAVARHLEPGGLLIVDLGVDPPGLTTTDWTVEAGDVVVHTQWGGDDVRDPLTGVDRHHVRIAARRGNAADPEVVVDEFVPGRTWTAARIQAIADTRGKLRLLARYGSTEEDIPIDPDAWRDIPVLAGTGPDGPAPLQELGDLVDVGCRAAPAGAAATVRAVDQPRYRSHGPVMASVRPGSCRLTNSTLPSSVKVGPQNSESLSWLRAMA
jgi:SAM-dependent methyltransferase